MQNDQSERRIEPRRSADRGASQAMGGQPRSDPDEDALQEPDKIPSHLTAQELQAKIPARSEPRNAGGGDESPRGDAEAPQARTERVLRKGERRNPNRY